MEVFPIRHGIVARDVRTKEILFFTGFYESPTPEDLELVNQQICETFGLQGLLSMLNYMSIEPATNEDIAFFQEVVESGIPAPAPSTVH